MLLIFNIMKAFHEAYTRTDCGFRTISFKCNGQVSVYVKEKYLAT